MEKKLGISKNNEAREGLPQIKISNIPAMYDNRIVATLTLYILNFPDHLTYATCTLWDFVFSPREVIEMPDVPCFSALHKQNNEYI